MILTNQVRHFLSGKRNQKVQGAAQPLSDWLEQLADPNSALSRHWDQEHDQQIVRRLLASIRSEFNPTTWQVFQMLVLQEHPVAEVAQRFGITPRPAEEPLPSLRLPNLIALAALLAEWDRRDSYKTRVQDLFTNGTTPLNASTVLNDAAVD
jgi:hypothetical protein